MTDLKTWRTKRNLTQGELAAMLGTNHPNISRIETGQQWPGPNLMSLIEKVTKGEVTASDVLRSYLSSQAAAE